MREEFEKLAAAGKIQRAHVETLVVLAESGYCTHKSWGFGRIKSVDTVFARFTIDFQTKQGHGMDLGFAAESLKAMARAGHGIAWIPRGAARSELASGALVPAGDQRWAAPLEVRVYHRTRFSEEFRQIAETLARALDRTQDA